VALLEALADADRPLDATEAAERVGLHRNTARVHLEQLSDAGLVERRSEQRSMPGRPKVLYTNLATGRVGVETPVGRGQEQDGVYQELARVLAAQLSATADPAGAAEQAGRRWSAALEPADLPAAPATAPAAIETVTDIMETLGFQPVADDRRIVLRRCPFAELARANRPVICGVHLGMLKQTFDAFEAPVTVKRLDPLVQSDPLLCVVHLTDRPPVGSDSRSDA